MSNYELRHIKAGGALDDGAPKAHEDSDKDIKSVPEVMIVNSTQICGPDGSSRPVDKYYIVFMILLLHGVGTLMPWNMFINADSYFRDYKLGSAVANDTGSVDASPEELVAIRKDFQSTLGSAAQLPNLLFNGFNLIARTSGSTNLKARVNATLLIEILIFTITIVLAGVDSSHWPKAFYYATLASVVVLNMASGIYQNCIFGTGAMFPSAYTNAILIGSNLSGTFTSVVNILAIWMAPRKEVAAVYYFVTALFVVVGCVVSYNLLSVNRFYRHYERLSDASADRPTEVDCNKTELTIVEGKATTPPKSNELPATLKKAVEELEPRSNGACVQEPSFKEGLLAKWKVFKKCHVQCLNVFFTFYISLALFPAVLAGVKRQQDYFSDTYFTPFACFFVFNVSAMIGNLISGWTTWPGKRNVHYIVILRLALVPFFLLCNFNPATRHWPVYITNDVVFILGNVVLALTSGYLSSLCMMFASCDVKPDEAPQAGMLAAFFLVFGIFAGVQTSFLLTRVVELG